MGRLSIPPGVEWELLVVDNNCSDDTPAVISHHASHLPIRQLSEPRQGLSNARNCAIEAARGDIILWTDDDALVDPGWLAGYVNAANTHADASFFGGPVDPWFSVEPPRWLEANLSVFAGAYAVRRMPHGTLTLNGKDSLPFGANFAVRREGFVDLRFDTRLGRTGSDLMGGEEVQFMGQLLDQGYFGVWVDEARVRHFIPEDRVSQAYLWDYYYDKGRSRIRMTPAADYPPLTRLVLKYWKTRIKAWSANPRRDARWARAFKASAMTKGIVDALRLGNRGEHSHAPGSG